MKTKRLFKENRYLRETEAEILEITDFEGSAAVIFDRTVFFPEGGGQPCDLGEIILEGSGISVPVIKVTESDGEILNIIKYDGTLTPGQKCIQKLDWKRRFDSMQRHTGEHIFTGIFYREFGGTNRGFHMGDDYMTIDISLEENAKVDTLTWEMVKRAELLSNEVIYADLPVTVRHFDSYSEAACEPMRKPLAIDKDITLVGIGGTDEAWGCVACCGTHLLSTAQVGLIKAYKLESNKGMYRIYFEAGRRAFIKCQDDFETLRSIGRRLSAGTEDILSKYDSQAEKNGEKSRLLSLLKKEIITREADRIRDSLSASENTGSLPCERYRILSPDDLSALGRALSPDVRKLLLLVHEPSLTVLLVSDGKIDCGKLVKENAGIYNGKGGGSNVLARAIFSRKDYLETFMDLLEKHLR